jgi:hypothetical protein
MRDTDRVQAAEAIDQGDVREIQHRDAVPQDISTGRASK